jgi:hypothetical protein
LLLNPTDRSRPLTAPTGQAPLTAMRAYLDAFVINCAALAFTHDAIWFPSESTAAGAQNGGPNT